MFMLGASIMVAGCGSGGGSKGASGESGKAKDKILTVGYTNAPSGVNPLSTPDVAAHLISRYMYDTLLGQPDTNKFTPHLALSIDTKDKQTYTIKLNPKAQWSDGKPITADDVVFTLNLAANPNVISSLGRYMNFMAGLSTGGKLKAPGTIPGLKKVDDHTVEFKTKKPIDPNIVKAGLGFNVNIVPKHVFEKIEPKNLPNAKEVTNPTVFSGPYKFVKYVTNDHMELVANDKYVLGAPKIKRLFLSFASDTNLVVNLKAGKVQINAISGVGKIPVKEIDGLKADKKLEVKEIPADSSQFLMPNCSKFNVHFRRALSYAINKDQLVNQLFKGHADVTPTLYTRPSSVFDKDLKGLEYSPEKAKAELAQSGFDTSKELTLLVPIGNSLREQSAEPIQQNLKAIGLNVKISKVDFPTLLANARKGTFDMLLIGLSQPPDPDYSTYFAPGSLSNYSMANDEKLMEMFEEGIQKTDFADRKKIYTEIQKYLNDNQFQIVLYNPQNTSVKAKNLVGGVTPYWDGSLDDIYKWELK